MTKTFNKIDIVTKEKTFRFANCTLLFALNDIHRYYDDSDITKITCE